MKNRQLDTNYTRAIKTKLQGKRDCCVITVVWLVVQSQQFTHTYCKHTNLILMSTWKLWHNIYIHLHAVQHMHRQWDAHEDDQEVGQKHDKKPHQHPPHELNLSVYKSGSAETKPHQSDSFITPCQVQLPQHHSICLPTHQLQVNNGPVLNFEADLTQNLIPSNPQSFNAELRVALKWAPENSNQCWESEISRDFQNGLKERLSSGLQTVVITVKYSLLHKAANGRCHLKNGLILWGQSILRRKERKTEGLVNFKNGCNKLPRWWKMRFSSYVWVRLKHSFEDKNKLFTGASQQLLLWH